MQEFPKWFDEYQARKVGMSLGVMKARWEAVMHDAPAWVRPGAVAVDRDGDQFIFLGPGGYRRARAEQGVPEGIIRPAGILAVFSYKGEWHFTDLSRSPDFDRTRWSEYTPI